MTRRWAIRAAMWCCAAITAAAQQQTGRLEGKVSDDGGKPLEGVVVKAQHTVRGTTSVVSTGGDGRYRVELPGGSYSLYLAKPGYCALWLRQVVVRPGETARRDASLAVDAACSVEGKGSRRKPR